MFQSILAAVSYYLHGENDNLSSRHIQLVQESWGAMSKKEEEAGLAFYNRLFTANPELTDLFTFSKEFKDGLNPEGRKFQGVKLMNMVGIAVRGLNNVEKLVPTLRKLGARHKKYGVKENHFKPVGEALIWVLQESQGDQFTAEHLKAWTAVYKVLMDAMIEGMNES